MATQIYVNTSSGIGLLPDGTKPLPEPVLTYLQQGPMTFSWAQFSKRLFTLQSLNKLENYLSKIVFKSPRGQWVDIIVSYGSSRWWEFWKHWFRGDCQIVKKLMKWFRGSTIKTTWLLSAAALRKLYYHITSNLTFYIRIFIFMWNLTRHTLICIYSFISTTITA